MNETLNEGRNEEVYFELKRMIDLRDLAKIGNIFAVNEQKFNETGLKANFEAFLTKQCTHRRKFTNGAELGAIFKVSQRRVKGWLVREKICVLCGKTTEITVVSSNQT